MTVSGTATDAVPCERCGTQLAPALLSCPGCRRLVHAVELQRISGEAERAEAAGETTRALELWRGALPLLPDDTRQHAGVSERVTALSRAAHAPAAPPKPAWAGLGARAGIVGTVALLAWKLKFVLVFALTKAKLLLLGLTKLSTLSSMLAFLGVYWAMWGWKFALGFVVSLYVHEMGHVAALRRAGIPASAPMFIPGVGAFVRLHQGPADPREDARIGLAGPVWGLGAAVAALAVYGVTGAPIWAAIARTGAWLNLFNLLPVWQLDGGRAFHALSRHQRRLAAGALLGAYLLTREGMLLLLLAGAVFQAFRPAPDEEDRGALATYAFLVFALAAFSFLP
ncbi:MAG TPA: site-2 protease family protein, partial [Longimicrobiaceae bacterium]